MGALGFLTPWMLLAFAALPAIWLLLRLTPPRPRRIDFPPTRILMGLDEREKTPARTPWWLTALRLLLAAFLIAALAGPVLRPEASLVAGEGPLLVVLDNGWDSAPDFDARRTAAETALREARDAGRRVALAATAEPAAGLEPGDYAQAAERLAALAPRPYVPDRAAFARRLDAAYGERSVDVLWIAGEVDRGGDALAATIARIAASATYVGSARPLTAMLPPTNGTESVLVPLRRLGAGGNAEIAGFDSEGRRIVEAGAAFDASGAAEVEITLPTEIRNELSRFAVVGEDSAGAVQLLDASWRRKAVGLIAGEGADASQPLLEPLTYVERALAPFADLMTAGAATTSGAIEELVRRDASVIVLTETGTLPPETAARLVSWVEAGGTLLRFASPNVSATTEDELLPAPLRQGERALGGSLSWEQPQTIGSFAEASPFADIAPPEDVRVERQVLADPAALTGAQTWAELADGTPLVTERAAGRGRIILFHVTADPRWSNLPLSGAFVEMLRAIVQTAGTVDAAAVADAAADPGAVAPAAPAPAQAAAAPWQPVQVLDGFGRLGPPEPTARMVADLGSVRPGPDTPPGYYDRAGTSRALNAVASPDDLAPLTPAGIGWSGGTGSLEPGTAMPIWPWLLAAAAILAVADALAVLLLAGRMTRLRPRAAMLLLAAALAAPLPRPAAAQESAADAAMQSVLSTRLAYVETGDPQIDRTSLEGLRGLTLYLSQRTALEPGEPIGIDLAEDELAFYALIYWPMDPAAALPSAETMARVDAFMKNGGTILFDTRDAGGFARSGDMVTPETERLRRILSFIDVPPLEPVPPDHVLGKAFFLLTEFPGRWNESELWVESLETSGGDPTRPARGGDGVSPILITGNDFASAWAIDDQNRFAYPTVPADPRQRELAFRSGVNIVMYALTGNYKADQVHIPALLERLGQ